jgi:hypothetical protein
MWLVVPLALYGVYTVYGLPHPIWSYSWIDEGQGYDPHAHRHYTRCTFIGPYGEFTVHPRDGRCGWVRFYKSPSRAG